MSIFSDLGSMLNDVKKMADDVNEVKASLVSSATESFKQISDTKEDLVKDVRDISDTAKSKVKSMDITKKPGSGSDNS